jgi:hypothetical protein
VITINAEGTQNGLDKWVSAPGKGKHGHGKCGERLYALAKDVSQFSAFLMLSPASPTTPSLQLLFSAEQKQPTPPQGALPLPSKAKQALFELQAEPLIFGLHYNILTSELSTCHYLIISLTRPQET